MSASPLLKNVKWKSLVKNRVPVIRWLPHYSTSKLFRDFLAGFTVSLTKVPQAIAFAAIAGLDPQYGLYSSFMGVFTYFLFGTCKDINIGPTSILSLMIQPHVTAMGPEIAIFTTFLSGVIIFILGLLKLGFLLEFFSYPVISGFTTSAALQIAATQLKSLLGIPGKASKFLNALIEVFQNISEIKLWDSLLGCAGIILILGLKKLGQTFGSSKMKPGRSKLQNLSSILIWFLALIRNAIIVTAATILAYVLHQNGYTPFNLTGPVRQGLPQAALPPFSATHNNQTFYLNEMVQQLGSTIAFVPLLAILGHVSIAKAFAQGKTIDATQELLALGLCNVFGSFVKSMPTTGSFTRTAVNNVSGVKTTMGGVFTGCFVLLALAFLTSFFYFIPRTTLASVVVCAMIGIIEYDTVFILWKTKKLDLIPYFATLLCCLLWNLEYGILLGIATNLFFVLFTSARPRIEFESILVHDKTMLCIARPETGLHFPASENLKDELLNRCNEKDSVLVIDGSQVEFIDTTIIKSFKNLYDELKKRNQTILFWNFPEKIIDTCVSFDSKLENCFVTGSIDEIIGEKIMFA